MRKLFRLTIILAAALTAAAWFSPVGAIDGGRKGPSDGDDVLWAVPRRQIYDLNPIEGIFDRTTDFQLFISIDGDVFIVPVSKAQLFMVENPGSAVESKIPIVNGKYVFQRSGRKMIEIHYDNLETFYNVEVRPSVFDGGDDGNGFFDIIWY